jgi:O-antigen/teichoic acid export membrane protein
VSDAPAAHKRSLAVRILINAMSGAGNRIATTAIGFLLTPFIISELGLSQYGLWAVVGSLAGYLGLLDFGLGGAFVKFITEYVELDDKRSARQVVMFGMAFYFGFGLLFAAPVLFFAPEIVHLFKMPPQQYAAAATLLRVFFGLLILAMVLGVPGMVVVSMQRMDLASRNGFIGYLAYAGTTLVLLKLHYGIVAVVAGQAAQIVLTGIIHIATAQRVFGSIWHNPLRVERAIVKRLFGFGGWTQLNTVFSVVNLDIGRFLAAGVVSVASVGLYEIASKLAFFAKLFPSYLLDAMMPAAARADARSDDGLLDRMYAAGTRYSVFATFACAGFVIGGADPMVQVWLGKPYPYVSEIVFWLALGYAANSLTGVGTTILRASGQPRYETYYTAVAMLANIASTIVLARSFGIVGVAIGTTIGWFAGTVYFLYVYHRVRNAPWWTAIGSHALRLFVADALATGAYYSVVHLPLAERCFENRALGLVLLAVTSALYFALFTALSILFGGWAQDGADIVARLGEMRSGLGRKFPMLGFGHRA